MQAAAVSIDNNSGYVVAIVGGRKQDSDNYTLNRAYQSYRQPGSSIKPLLVYTPQLERGYTPDTVVDDHKLKTDRRIQTIHMPERFRSDMRLHIPLIRLPGSCMMN